MNEEPKFIHSIYEQGDPAEWIKRARAVNRYNRYKENHAEYKQRKKEYDAQRKNRSGKSLLNRKRSGGHFVAIDAEGLNIGERFKRGKDEYQNQRTCLWMAGGVQGIPNRFIEADTIPITRLEKLYRTDERGGIALLASHFRNQLPLSPYYSNVVTRNVDETDIADKVLAEYKHLIKQGMEPVQIGVVTPYTKPQYLYSADKLNYRIREMLIRAGKLKGDINCPNVGDLVIGTRNHRTPKDKHDYLNGQRGIIIAASTCEVGIQFDGNDEPEYFDASELLEGHLPPHVSYGYATTIHKSQGGEYAHVIAIVPKNLNYTFGKRGLYTAITRAKETLTIIGAMDIIPDIMQKDEERRCTVLKSLYGLSLENKALQKQAERTPITQLNEGNIRAKLDRIRRELERKEPPDHSPGVPDDDLLTAMEANG